jgi:purine-binding chemotaxis protein CheW
MNAKQVEQLTTFYVGQELFGIDVMKVQEVTGKPSIIPVPLAPDFVRGLINIRGQISTALGLQELFRSGLSADDHMTVVCKVDGNLVSLIVDTIGDVVEVDMKKFETPPDSLPENVKRYVKGIYKLDDNFLSVIDLETLSKELSPNT